MMWTTKRKSRKFKPPEPNWWQMMKVWRKWHRPTAKKVKVKRKPNYRKERNRKILDPKRMPSRRMTS